MTLDKRTEMVSLYAMNAALASDGIPDVQTQPREITRRQMLEWFARMDRIWEIPRSAFVFRQPTSAELGEPKTCLSGAGRPSPLINALVADPDLNEPDLTARLQVRTRQLPDADDVFHDPTLSEELAGCFLKQVFPE